MSIFKEFEKDNKEQNVRVPPGQTLTKGFPVLTYGQTPNIQNEEWSCFVRGEGLKAFTIDFEDLLSLKQVEVTCDIHCVTRWSKLDTTWKGVPFTEVLRLIEEKSGPLDKSFTHVMQHASGGYTTNTTLETLLEENVLIAHTYNDAPLPAEHGGPVRMVVPRYYFWKSAKWLSGFEFMKKDRPGFWERYGYHNQGDPWTEERFS